MSEKPSSTLGYERQSNELFQLDDEATFVSELTAGLAPQPPNFARIVELNRGPLRKHASSLAPLTARGALELIEAGAVLIDGRAPRAWDAEHVPGSLSVSMVRAAVGTRAAWVVDPQAAAIITAASDIDAHHDHGVLASIGTVGDAFDNAAAESSSTASRPS